MCLKIAMEFTLLDVIYIFSSKYFNIMRSIFVIWCLIALVAVSDVASFTNPEPDISVILKFHLI